MFSKYKRDYKIATIMLWGCVIANLVAITLFGEWYSLAVIPFPLVVWYFVYYKQRDWLWRKQ